MLLRHCATLVNTVLIYEDLQKHELEYKEKQENGCSALWETILCMQESFAFMLNRSL